MDKTTNGIKASNGIGSEIMFNLGETVTSSKPRVQTSDTTLIGDMTIKVKWVAITPAIAVEWLKKNHQNRTVNKKKIERHAKAMKAGHWKITHQGIAFDVNGLLIDGQHRLEAIVLSGVTITMLVTSGLAPIARAALDTGDPRGPHHLISIIGINGVSRSDSALISKCVNMIRSGAYNETGKQEWEELKAHILRYRAGIRWAAEKCSTPSNKTIGVLRSGPVLGAFIFAYPHNPDAISALFDVFEPGNFQGKRSLQLLRDHVLTTGSSNARSGRNDLFCKSVTAIYQAVNGISQQKLLASNAAVNFFKRLYK